MQGYKIYYDKEEKIFKYEDTKSEVKSLAPDSTTCWNAELKTTIQAVESYNSRLDEVFICKDCGESFFLTHDEQAWYTERNLHIPVRCHACRKKRKTNNNN